MKNSILLFGFLIILHCSLYTADCLCQWEPDYRLTFSTGASILSHNNQKCIESNSSTVHVVWYDSRDGNPEIYYKRSTDNGYFWLPDIRLTNNPYHSTNPSVALSGSSINVVWQDDRDLNWEIYYKNSTDGINWGAGMRLTQDTGYSQYPAIDAYGLFVHVVWEDDRNGDLDIYYIHSTDGGTTFGNAVKLTPGLSDQTFSSIAVNGSTVHLAWCDDRDGNEQIYYKKSTNNGINWGADVRLTNHSFLSGIPSISVSGSNVHIVWYDNRNGNWEIYNKRSTNSGVNWLSDVRLTNNIYQSLYPSVTVSGLNVHVVWMDNRDGNEEIYYKSSTDYGANWGTGIRLTNNTATSNFPYIAAYGQFVHVVWEDYRTGAFPCIYYKRNPTGNIGIRNISSEVPTEFMLYQNYPNPFNAVTSIKFQVASVGDRSQETEVMLIVFDLLGREVATLVNEKLQAGTYEVTFDAGNLPSGVYFYKLLANNFSATKKLVLQK